MCDACWALLTIDRTDSPGLFVYDGVCRSIVLGAKNRGRRDLFRPLGRALADDLMRRIDPGTSWVVTWIPASRDGRRTRGHDQGRLLARSVAARLGLPARRLLWRLEGPSQTGRPRAERLVGPSLGAAPFVPAHLVLVDDVTTTGATLDAGVRCLLEAGARRVVPAALATVPEAVAASPAPGRSIRRDLVP